jgi:hypothetical protein
MAAATPVDRGAAFSFSMTVEGGEKPSVEEHIIKRSPADNVGITPPEDSSTVSTFRPPEVSSAATIPAARPALPVPVKTAITALFIDYPVFPA